MKTGTLVIKSTEYNTLSFVVKEYGADTKNTKRFCPTLVVQRIWNSSCTGNPQGVWGSKTDLTEVVIPDGISVIGPSAFSDCEHLKSVVLPDSVKRIYRITFLRCRNLTSVSLPHGLKTVGKYVFAGCTELKSLCFRPPADRVEAVFIVWAVSVERNRDIFQLTTIVRLHNVLRLITVFASESLAPRSIDKPKTLTTVFAGCSKLIPKFGILDHHEFCSVFFNAKVLHATGQISSTHTLYAILDKNNWLNLKWRRYVLDVPIDI